MKSFVAIAAFVSIQALSAVTESRCQELLNSLQTGKYYSGDFIFVMHPELEPQAVHTRDSYLMSDVPLLVVRRNEPLAPSIETLVEFDTKVLTVGSDSTGRMSNIGGASAPPIFNISKVEVQGGTCGVCLRTGIGQILYDYQRNGVSELTITVRTSTLFGNRVAAPSDIPKVMDQLFKGTIFFQRGDEGVYIMVTKKDGPTAMPTSWVSGDPDHQFYYLFSVPTPNGDKLFTVRLIP